eukprot:TRINITY_DN111554_c0_g1_i1.p1 TRINITY_DN111554_c0_g1~~TRINITY_DN111554_c0_g1_i1.p1  ORF type:complete len:363 (-),score=54.69 TRINITY_DN111554_c0_g1_i1:6-1094(-)
MSCEGREICPEPASELHCSFDSWEFPLSRREKVLRLLHVFQAETDAIRHENSALRARAEAAELELAQAKKLIEELTAKGSGAQSSSSSRSSSSRSSRAQAAQQSQNLPYDLQHFERKMEQKAQEALAAAADLDYEADGRNSDFESAVSSSVPSPRRPRLLLASSSAALRHTSAERSSSLQPAQPTPPSTPNFTHRSVCASGPAPPPNSPALVEPGCTSSSASSAKTSERGRGSCLPRSPLQEHRPFVVRSSSWAAKARMGCAMREDSVDPLPALMTPVLTSRSRHCCGHTTGRSDKRSPRGVGARVGSPEPVLRRVVSKESAAHPDRSAEPPEPCARGLAGVCSASGPNAGAILGCQHRALK